MEELQVTGRGRMRATVMKAASPEVGRSCHQCTRVIRVGEVVITQRFNLTRGHYHTVRYHAGCLAQIIGSAPTDATDKATERAFQRARTELLTAVQEGKYTHT